MNVAKDDTLKELPKYWKKIHKCASKIMMTEKEKYMSAYLYNQYMVKHCISDYSFNELLNMHDMVFIEFYINLYFKLGYESKRPSQVIEKATDSNWMMERDYCFINLRALGNEVAETGNIINAIKILPILRVTGIHLAPFFECSEGIIYCQKSFHRINHEIVNKLYLDNGVMPVEQMKFFIDCCHLLDMAVGFDITPHTSYDSALRLENPSLFRWVKLSKNKENLYSDMNIDDQYTNDFQKKCQNEIHAIVEKHKKDKSIDNLDAEELLYGEVDATIDEINRCILEEGFYTVPPHTWNVFAVLGFKKFACNSQMPIWEYRDKYGQNQGEHAIWLHANYYIHLEMKANKIPCIENNSIKNENFFDFFKKYLRDIIANYLFDYIRIDYVDHIFDNILNEGEKEIPLTEMLTPNEILEIINYLRDTWPGLGMQADHLGKDVTMYAKAGFNLITNSDVSLEYNSVNLRKIFGNLINAKQECKSCRMLWAIDTHDMAHPLFLGKELALREGKMGIVVRFFLSRFANIGRERQPKYEVIGNQDLSFGIHRANNRPESLSWKSNQEVLEIYHEIETQYLLMREDLNESKLVQFTVTNNVASFLVCHPSLLKGWIGVVPVPIVGNNKEIETITLDNIFAFKDRGIPILKSIICYEISESDHFNRTSIEHLCILNFCNTSKKIELTFSNKGLMLIEVNMKYY